ncbi:NAD(P)/FAD-dependent oxidoreductase [Aquabacterium sp. CECT 9606]|uniref:NAD(P)/FAD-dependent oxidoreductase n=1 Tax=Aquabacterium sp. CECT 9606 TaxID=2845822 RepID=UPI001E3E8EAE|nr:FAD-dependent oxidoreductase [Aquabacterium sp. CECT 9606]CAH0354092.1 Rubredoxin-NAD(+) reductase [Aquabacterium sp. CECT 9606]
MSSDSVVIIGSGLAGYNVARELRKLDAQVPIVVVSRDHAGFYSKPMLSNALAGKKTAATLVMKAADKIGAEINARVVPHSTVERLDTQARTILLGNGEVLPYRDLVLAMGADPIRLPLKGNAADSVLSVNDLDDFAKFAEALDHPDGVKHVTILGAGLIGCEFANDLLHRGIEPTVLDLADRALGRLLPEAASLNLQTKLQAAGARFRFGVAVQSVDLASDGPGLQVTLTDGSTFKTDLVLSAIGLKPRTALAASAGLQINRGIVTDRHLATSAEHVYAVGDCAEVDGHTLPYVLPLMQQARALAAGLAGQKTPVAYPAMPVIVKTPACPTVVCPPPLDAAGEWTVTTTDDALDARFTAPGQPDQLLGFALQGKAVSQRQALAALIPPLWI